MAKTAFLETKLIFQSYKDLYIVSTDADYIYIENDKNDAEYFFIKISIDDWEEIIAFTSKMLKNG